MVLQVSDFTSLVSSITAEAEQFKNSKIMVSDTIDSSGHQYVDLVQEGGGVLGIALVGYTYIMEQAGIRFFSLAGTSAGAINTLMLASLGKVEDEKSEIILKYLVKKNLFDFVDGAPSPKRLIQSYVNGELKGFKLRTIPQMIKAILILFRRLGINPGVDFEKWITGILNGHDIKNTQQLLELREKLPEGIKFRGSNEKFVSKPRLVIVASDLTTQSKVHFPEMAELYWDSPGEVHPAKYVRASMSIPLFFNSFEIKNIPTGPSAPQLWKEHVRYKGDKVPGTVRMVDGGLLSNFPINVFHQTSKMPTRPTFGVRLSAARATLNKTNRLLPYLGSMIKTMRHLYDADFILKHPDYWRLICRLDTDNDFNWLDFNMSEENKLKLFEVGARGAMDFLNDFNWKEYKNDRKQIYQLP